MFLVRLPLDDPEIVPGTNRICALSQEQTQAFSLFYTMEAQFVPGTIAGTKGDRKSLCVKSLWAFFTRYRLLATALTK